MGHVGTKTTVPITSVADEMQEVSTYQIQRATCVCNVGSQRYLRSGYREARTLVFERRIA
jgi:hypothetical protein